MKIRALVLDHSPTTISRPTKAKVVFGLIPSHTSPVINRHHPALPTHGQHDSFPLLSALRRNKRLNQQTPTVTVPSPTAPSALF
jgi:hypothetical protein